jgi:hypothetical protein
LFQTVEPFITAPHDKLVVHPQLCNGGHPISPLSREKVNT